METKLATATSAQVSQVSTQHWNLDQQIMDTIRGMTLAGKRALADRISTYCGECEKEAR